MLTETKEIDQIQIMNNVIHVREKTIIKKDDIEIASSFHRITYSIEDDLSSVDQKVLAIAKAIWPDKFLTTDTVSGSI